MTTSSFPSIDWLSASEAPEGTGLLCLVAGLCDTSTGLLLVAAPATTLGLLGLDAGADPFAHRFVGTFVAGVGLAYLLPFALDPARRAARWRGALETTALLRVLVATFLVLTVVVGAEPLGWLTVATTDATLAGLQIAWLRRWPRAEAVS